MPDILIIGPRCRERFVPTRESFARPLREHGIRGGGLSELSPPYEIARDDPPFHQLIFTISGTGWLQSNDRKEKLEASRVCIMPAHHPHHYGATQEWRNLWLQLDDDPRWSHLGNSGLRQESTRDLNKIHHAVDEYLHEALTHTSASEHAAALLAELIGVYLERETQPDEDITTRIMRAKLQHLWNEVDANLHHPWRVPELAAKIHVSAVHFHRLIKQYYATSPVQILTRLRMRRAVELLHNTDYPIYIIAEMTGYQTPFSFSKAFRRWHDRSPQSWRKTSSDSPKTPHSADRITDTTYK